MVSAMIVPCHQEVNWGREKWGNLPMVSGGTYHNCGPAECYTNSHKYASHGARAIHSQVLLLTVGVPMPESMPLQRPQRRCKQEHPCLCCKARQGWSPQLCFAKFQLTSLPSPTQLPSVMSRAEPAEGLRLEDQTHQRLWVTLDSLTTLGSLLRLTLFLSFVPMAF